MKIHADSAEIVHYNHHLIHTTINKKILQNTWGLIWKQKGIKLLSFHLFFEGIELLTLAQREKQSKLIFI